MKIELSEGAQKWQTIAREYADDYLQPHEVEAELNDGVLPAEVTARNKARAIELGFTAIDVPKAYGGLELSMEEQVAIWEQLGRIKQKSLQKVVPLSRNLHKKYLDP